MNAVVEIDHLGVRFGSTCALTDVNLAFERGTVHALLGPNGAGKTTILKAVLGAVEHTGVIRTDPPQLRIGHLIEYPAFYGRLTILENLRLHADYLGVPDAPLADLVDLVGLGAQKDLPCSQASLGMRQRLGIARSLVGDPNLLLLDEPTNGLDPMGIRDCRELLRRVRDERDVAVVVSSHNLAEVGVLADRLTFVKSGHVVHSVASGQESPEGLEALYIDLMQEGDR